MRLAALLLVALLAPLAVAHGESDCVDRVAFEPEPILYFHTGAVVEQRDCDGMRSFHASVREPNGRVSLEWYDDERGRGLEAFYPPYFVSWTDTERGCVVMVYVFSIGAVEHGCFAGEPPEPIHVPL